MKALLLAALLSSSPARAEAPPTAPVVELYGSDRVGERELSELVVPLARRYQQERAAGDRKAPQRAAKLHERIEDLVRSRWRFAWVRLEPPRSLPDGGEHLAIEAVEPAEKSLRMPFFDAPKGSEPDPAGLLKDWEAYSETGWERVRKGEVKMDRHDCPGYFCTWGSTTPELERLESRFVIEVPNQREALLRVLRQDADGRRRAAALYLLSYSRNGGEVCSLAGDALLDPDPQVREAGMRILSDIALHHPDIRIPVERVLGALNYPYSEDRTRALAVLLALAESKEYRAWLLERAVPRLLRLLRLKHPANHSMAHAVLGMLSKKTIDERDYGSWEDWYRTAVSTGAASR